MENYDSVRNINLLFSHSMMRYILREIDMVTTNLHEAFTFVVLWIKYQLKRENKTQNQILIMGEIYLLFSKQTVSFTIMLQKQYQTNYFTRK